MMSVQQQCQNPEDLEEELEAGGKVPYVGTRIQRRVAKKKWVRFAADLSLEGEDFESVGTRRPDGTLDMEPANLHIHTDERTFVFIE
ncbi:MAG: hypothetical protein GY696_41130 [Gammaproteobacteria bacterium]|nr:hypothetical protein [Gammaproteobacteria bacterium]